MKEFENVLKAFRRLMLFSVGIAALMTMGLLFRFDVLSFPEMTNEKVVLEVPIKTSLEDDLPGVIGSLDKESGLIIDHGFNIVKTQCGSCHSTKLVAQNRLSRAGWLELIRWMQESQNLWDLGDQEDIILDYLERNFAPQVVGRRKALEIKEWYVLKE